MNRGIEILLKRMDSNPDEFKDGQGKWDKPVKGICRAYNGEVHEQREFAFLTPDEMTLIYNKYQELRAKQFTDKIMEKLLDDPHPEKLSKTAVGMTAAGKYGTSASFTVMDERGPYIVDVPLSEVKKPWI